MIAIIVVIIKSMRDVGLINEKLIILHKSRGIREIKRLLHITSTNLFHNKGNNTILYALDDVLGLDIIRVFNKGIECLIV